MAGRYEPLARGVWGILATPFQGENLDVDTASLARLVGLYERVGASGVVALGVLGEAARLSTAERRLVLETVVAAAGPLPVVAGMAATATAPAIEEARAAAGLGARAVMVPVPGADPAVVAEHLRRIAGASGLGIVLQDHPAATGVAIPPKLLAQAAREAAVVVALKAEAPPTAPTVAILAGESGVPVFGGLGGVGLLDELAAGFGRRHDRLRRSRGVGGHGARLAGRRFRRRAPGISALAAAGAVRVPGQGQPGHTQGDSAPPRADSGSARACPRRGHARIAGRRSGGASGGGAAPLIAAGGLPALALAMSGGVPSRQVERPRVAAGPGRPRWRCQLLQS